MFAGSASGDPTECYEPHIPNQTGKALILMSFALLAGAMLEMAAFAWCTVDIGSDVILEPLDPTYLFYTAFMCAILVRRHTASFKECMSISYSSMLAST